MPQRFASPSALARRRIQEKFAGVFRKDGNYSLVLRLRHNVIKTGLRKIIISYSCISFDDISLKVACARSACMRVGARVLARGRG